jgi:hypothetical protein
MISSALKDHTCRNNACPPPRQTWILLPWYIPELADLEMPSMALQVGCRAFPKPGTHHRIPIFIKIPGQNNLAGLYITQSGTEKKEMKMNFN